MVPSSAMSKAGSGSAASKAGASIVAVDGVRERVDDGNGDLLGSSFSLGP
jgi:hypothetical protein